MHQILLDRGVMISQRSAPNALYRYDELVSTWVRDTRMQSMPQLAIVVCLSHGN
jgi:hypothetical protein